MELQNGGKMVNEFKYVKSRKHRTNTKDWRERRRREEEQMVKLEKLRGGK